MATREELADTLAGFAMFADLGSPQLLGGRADCSRRQVHAEGERVLRQGLTGSAFYVILDGDGRGPDRRHRPRARSSAATSSARSRSCWASRRRPTSSRRAPCAACARAIRRPAVPARQPVGDVPDAPGPGAATAQREPLAELTVARPTTVPAGCYPVVVVGSRAGRPPVSRTRSRASACDHAVLSADDGAGRHVPAAGRSSSGCCRGPSRTPRPRRRPAPTSATTGTACWPTSRRTRRSCRRPHGRRARTSRRGPEMQANLETFAARAGIRVRYGTPLGGDPARGRRRTARRFVLGDDRRRVPVADARLRDRRRPAVRCPATPGIELAVHYADTRDAAETYAGQRVFIIGKQNSRLRARVRARPVGVGDHRLLSVARQDQSSRRKSLVGVRARYVQPFEDSFAGPGGVRIIDAAITGLGARRGRDPGRRSAGPTRRRAVRRGRRGDRRDRLHVPAPRPAGARGRDVRREPSCRP